jgi:hypothetical protein
MAALALLEVLDRDGAARHGLSVSGWPVRVGRALDNDLVLDDPHVAAHHFCLDVDERGVFVAVGDSVNGVRLGSQTLAAGQRQTLGNAPAMLLAGRSLLRLRQAASPVPPELPLAPTTRLHRQGPGPAQQMLLLLLAVLAATLFDTYLASDPDDLVRALGGQVLWLVSAAMGWCGLWALLSKVFARQGHFLWHLRVLLCAVLAWQAVTALCLLLAFSLSWDWLSDFRFVATSAVAGAALYFHLLAVEPHRVRHMRTVAIATAGVAVALTLWVNWQENERLGDELYMNHLFPPALRLAQPVDTATFMQGVAPLEAALDEAAEKLTDDVPPP